MPQRIGENLASGDDEASLGLRQASITTIAKISVERWQAYKQARLYKELAGLHDGSLNRLARGRALLGAGVFYAQAGLVRKSANVLVAAQEDLEHYLSASHTWDAYLGSYFVSSALGNSYEWSDQPEKSELARSRASELAIEMEEYFGISVVDFLNDPHSMTLDHLQ